MRVRALAAVAAALLLSLPACAAADDLVVIVHPSRGVSLDAHALAQIYLKQRRHWRGGDAIVPVNREPGSAEREWFATAVLGRTPGQLVLYWNRQYFHGVQPPATLASDEAVRRFVASEPRAIGYVRASALDGSVRAVLRLPDVSPAAPPSRPPPP
jgi:ABC-type phosphate transport system substrate-binding protein